MLLARHRVHLLVSVLFDLLALDLTFLLGHDPLLLHTDSVALAEPALLTEASRYHVDVAVVVERTAECLQKNDDISVRSDFNTVADQEYCRFCIKIHTLT